MKLISIMTNRVKMCSLCDIDHNNELKMDGFFSSCVQRWEKIKRHQLSNARAGQNCTRIGGRTIDDPFIETIFSIYLSIHFLCRGNEEQKNNTIKFTFWPFLMTFPANNILSYLRVSSVYCTAVVWYNLFFFFCSTKMIIGLAISKKILLAISFFSDIFPFRLVWMSLLFPVLKTEKTREAESRSSGEKSQTEWN